MPNSDFETGSFCAMALDERFFVHFQFFIGLYLCMLAPAALLEQLLAALRVESNSTYVQIRLSAAVHCLQVLSTRDPLELA